MNPSTPNPVPAAPPTRDPDLLNAAVALQRSARKALEIALQTGTPCYIWRDGRVVNVGAPADVAPVAARAG